MLEVLHCGVKGVNAREAVVMEPLYYRCQASPCSTIRLEIVEKTNQIAASSPVDQKERRTRRRAKVARNVLIRPCDPRYREEVQATANWSRDGLYFVTSSRHYYVSMRLTVTSDYEANDPCKSSSFGEIVRIDKLDDGKLGIAVRILLA